MMEEIITRAKTKLPDLLGEELSRPSSDIETINKLAPWAVQSRTLGLCIMCILDDDEDEAFNSFLTHRFLRPIPIALVEEAFEVRFGYILVSNDAIQISEGKLIIKKTHTSNEGVGFFIDL